MKRQWREKNVEWEFTGLEGLCVGDEEKKKVEYGVAGLVQQKELTDLKQTKLLLSIFDIMWSPI